MPSPTGLSPTPEYNPSETISTSAPASPRRRGDAIPDSAHHPSPWKTAPRRTSIIFLLAVFFVFASFGFAADSMDMGRQPALHFAISVVLSGLFSVAYAAAGITLRRKFWMALIPLFLVQALSMGVISNWLPDGPRLDQFNPAQTAHLHNRLVFDGCAIIVSVTLGYIGFVYVSISEGRRHVRSELEKASLESEMAAAREVQRVMVPEDLPSISGYTLESVYRPAAEVGGDFFQVIPLPSGRTLVVIGDVSGKGLRAAMIVSMIVGMLRTVSGFTEEPAAILDELNRRLAGRTYGGFATCLVVRLEEQGRLTLANAGHPPPYLNGAEAAFPGSVPLGLVENTAYLQTNIQMRAGDEVMLITDGIPEAQNAQRVLLGFPRVESLLRGGATARFIADTAQQHGQSDDLTVIRIALAV